MDVDVAIVGGGMAGLWILSVLRHAGYTAVLFEKDRLGSAQSLASQGIIHGGVKYALLGRLSHLSKAARPMPMRWQAHLTDQRFPHLSKTNIHTHRQWIWKVGMGSSLTGFFANQLISSQVQMLDPDQRPQFLQNYRIYQLNDPVLDVRSVMQTLADWNESALCQAEVLAVEQRVDQVILRLRTNDQELELKAAALVLSAGAGNEQLQAVKMQRRGLHMVMAKGDLPRLYAHIIKHGANPYLTITSHPAQQMVWYLGGQLAETGVDKEPDKQIDCAYRQLSTLFPAIDWQAVHWASVAIDRAEAWDHGQRPQAPKIVQNQRQITLWPSKLLFVPQVADQVLTRVEQMGIARHHTSLSWDQGMATMGQYPWEQAKWQAIDQS